MIDLHDIKDMSIIDFAKRIKKVSNDMNKRRY